MAIEQRSGLLGHRLTPPAALALLTVLVYASSFPGSFILDDLVIVQQNTLVQHLDLLTIFRTDYWHGVENSGLFRPLTILSLALNRMLTGPSAGGFHLVNVLLHTGVVLLLWYTLRAWGISVPAALAAAALFAVHPVHLEVVNVVVGRSELLVALFLLAGLLAACRDGLCAGVLVGCCYLLALLSKEHAITFLALLPLWDLFRSGVERCRQRWSLYAGLVAITAGWLIWRQYALINPLPAFPLTEAAAPLAFVPAETRILTALHLQWLYLGKLLVPVGLQAVYAPNDLPAFTASTFSLRGVVILGASAGAVLLLAIAGWRRSLVALCALSYLLAFTPTANLLFPIGVSFAERLAYFPSVWFCAALGLLFAVLLQQERWRGWVWTLGIAYLLGHGAALVVRSPVYASEVRLWQAEVKENPRDFLGWQSLAQSLTNQRRIAEADRAFRTMLELAPDYPGGLRTYTTFLVSQGRHAEALPVASKVYSLSAGREDLLGMAFDGLDLAEVLLGVGRCAEALDYLDGPALPLQNSRALEVRSSVLSCLGRDEEVVALASRLDIEALPPVMRYNFGLSLFRLGRIMDARAQLEQVVAGRADAEAWNFLGVICTRQYDWAAALVAFARAIELAPEREEYRENLQRARTAATARN